MVDIQRTSEGEIEVMKVVGEVDASSSIELDNAIRAAVEDGKTKLLFDCTALDYISSAGLGVFMSYIEDFKQKGIEMVISGLSPKVTNVFEILGLDQLLEIKKTREEAKASLS